MPIETDLSTSPYFDDYKANNDYYKILFKPGVPVQTRELNQLQTILQSQVEKFGDVIFKQGTIVDGCAFTFHDKLKYVKIKDNDVTGGPVTMTTYKNKFVKNSSNLVAQIIDTSTGFESQAPDLNTLHLRYINSGTTYNETSFVKNTILEIYRAERSLEKVVVNDGGSSFSNGDTVVVYPAIAIQNSTGGNTFAANTWVLNTKIVQDTSNAEAEILEVNTSIRSDAVVLKIRPLTADLSSSSGTANDWNMDEGFTITGANLDATQANLTSNALVVDVIGQDATGSLVTDSTGKITTVSVTARGSNYDVEPHITVQSTTGTITSANLEGYNYISKVTAQDDDAAVGNSYGFSVSDGVIYQKGFFSRVSPNFVIVEKYANTTQPHEKVAGFNTSETLSDYVSDDSLLDNATGAPNYTAPGADRLKLSPTLSILTKAEAEANANFFSLVEFNKGRPFKQLRTTQFNKLADELAQRTFEESGNYVLNPFYSVSTSVDTFADEANNYSLTIDSGTAYIRGRRVESYAQFSTEVPKATTTRTTANASIDVVYGNYIRIKNLAGRFPFNWGETVNLYSSNTSYLSNSANFGNSAVTPAGDSIGQARIRSLVYDEGTPGTENGVYRLYLFDINMDRAKSLKDVKGIYHNGGTYKGWADTIQTTDPLTGTVGTKLIDSSVSALLFDSRFEAVKSLTNLKYKVRTVDSNVSISTAGQITVTNAATVTWPYSGELTETEQENLIVVPLANNETANIGNDFTYGSSGNTLETTAESDFVANLVVGDFIKVYTNSTTNEVKQVTGFGNATVIEVDSNFTTAANTTGANVSFFVPHSIPLNISKNPRRNANVNSNQLRIYLNPPSGSTFDSTTNVSVAYTATKTVAATNVKNTNRLRYVKLQMSNNAVTNSGPWFLGVSDIFRLRNVYKHTATTVNVNSTNITNEFYIENNHRNGVVDGGYLYKKPGSSEAINTTDFLLVEYDAFVTNTAPYAVGSYQIKDDWPLGNATTANTLSNSSLYINTAEIPQVSTNDSIPYADLRDYIDFRVTANNIANTQVTTDSDANMTVNPAIPSFDNLYDRTSEKHFPTPEGDAFFDVEFYLPRVDNVVMTSNADFKVVKGIPDQADKVQAPQFSEDMLLINRMDIPAYPTYPTNLKSDMLELLDTKVASTRILNIREDRFKLSESILPQNAEHLTQATAYSMQDIGGLERRLETLEYAAQLTNLEDSITQKEIPSSANSATQRYKFGFFVDNFQGTNGSDTTNPEYRAIVFNSRLTADKEILNLPMVWDTSNSTTLEMLSSNTAYLKYDEVPVVRQLAATYDPAESVGDLDVTVQETAESESVADATNKNVDVRYTFSNTSATSILYFQALGSKDRYEIHQGTTPNFTISSSTLVASSADAVSLTAAEKNSLKSKRSKVMENEVDVQFEAQGGEPKYWVKYLGKVTWTHIPASGRYYKIRAISGGSLGTTRLHYPVDRLTNLTRTAFDTSADIENCPTCKVNFAGAVNGVRNRKLVPYRRLTDTTVTKYDTRTHTDRRYSFQSNGEQKVLIEISALKPLSRHNFFFGAENRNHKCKALHGPLNGTFGTAGASSLVTDENGKLRFHFFFDAGLNTGITYTNKVKTQDIINRITGNKDIEIKNSDESSTAKFQLTIAINERTNPTKVHDRRTPKPKLKKCIIRERVKTSHNGGVHGSPTYGYKNRTVYREKCPQRRSCYHTRGSYSC